jgi:23S rRNA (pseudouridine1915-N3)-methyltransferase
MRIAVISVGAPKSPGLAEAIRDYESRISHYFRFEVTEVRPQRIPAGADTTRIVEKESKALMEKLPPGLEPIVLDQRGSAWTSEDLAKYLDGLALQRVTGVAFLIGGPLGFSDSLRREARKMISLSSFTLPHEMARLVLAEQLYRAGTILRGEPYHKSG